MLYQFGHQILGFRFLVSDSFIIGFSQSWLDEGFQQFHLKISQSGFLVAWQHEILTFYLQHDFCLIKSWIKLSLDLRIKVQCKPTCSLCCLCASIKCHRQIRLYRYNSRYGRLIRVDASTGIIGRPNSLKQACKWDLCLNLIWLHFRIILRLNQFRLLIPT